MLFQRSLWISLRFCPDHIADRMGEGLDERRKSPSTAELVPRTTGVRTEDIATLHDAVGVSKAESSTTQVLPGPSAPAIRRCPEAIVDRAGRDIAPLRCPSARRQTRCAVNALYGWPSRTRAFGCASSRGDWSPPIAPPLSGASLSLCSSACSMVSRSRIHQGAARGGLPEDVEGDRILHAGRRLAFQCARCNAATRASTIPRSPRIWSASAPTFSANSWRRIRKFAARVSLSSNTDVTLDMLPYIKQAAWGRTIARTRGRRSMRTC